MSNTNATGRVAAALARQAEKPAEIIEGAPRDFSAGTDTSTEENVASASAPAAEPFFVQPRPIIPEREANARPAAADPLNELIRDDLERDDHAPKVDRGTPLGVYMTTGDKQFTLFLQVQRPENREPTVEMLEFVNCTCYVYDPVIQEALDKQLSAAGSMAVRARIAKCTKTQADHLLHLSRQMQQVAVNPGTMTTPFRRAQEFVVRDRLLGALGDVMNGSSANRGG